jgi:hypothetical protein
MTNGNDAAFARPISTDTADGPYRDGIRPVREADGLTKREYFAAMAMRCWEIDKRGIKAIQSGQADYGTMSQFCVVFAEALIEALNKS